MSNVAVRYEGSGANMNGLPDIDGDRFWIEDVEGMDGMDTELQLSDHHRDGSAYTKGRYPKRELLVKGWGQAPGNIDFGSMRIRGKIESWFSDYLWNERWLYVDIPAPGTSVQFKTRPGGKVHFPVPRANAQQFEIPFTCADPRKYVQILSTDNLSATGNLNNLGNFPTFLYATLVSAATDPFIQSNTLGNQRITLQGSIPIGTTVDFYARRTMRSGTTLEEMAQRPRNWFPLIPGNNVITTNATWAVSWRNAFR